VGLGPELEEVELAQDVARNLQAAEVESPLIGGASLSPSQLAYLPLKRAVDIILALAFLVLAAPLLALLAGLIRIDSRGPVLFRQQRVGRGGRLFTIYKLRSMHVHAPAYATKAAVDDPRVTRVGRFLRLSGLDELPQLWNVLLGDLSLVGPRPEMAFLADRFEPWQRGRHAVRPGITGAWQVNHRSGQAIVDGVGHDLRYIEQMSPLTDIRIVLATLMVVGRGVVEGCRAAREA
jgi:lipopolysaccharide/colanic/teichoic acid biosynthesis glycosyltransferase